MNIKGVILKKIVVLYSILFYSLPLNAILCEIRVTQAASAEMQRLQVGQVGTTPISLTIDFSNTGPEEIERQSDTMETDHTPSALLHQFGLLCPVACVYRQEDQHIQVTRNNLMINQEVFSYPRLEMTLSVPGLNTRPYLNIDPETEEHVLVIDFSRAQGFFFQ